CKYTIANKSTTIECEIQNKKIIFIGSKTETVLLGFLLSDLNLDNIKSLRDNAQIIQLFPFNSERKAMGVVIKINDSKWRFYVKGASEVVLKKAGTIINSVRSGDNATTDNVINLIQHKKVQDIIENYAV